MVLETSPLTYRYFGHPTFYTERTTHRDFYSYPVSYTERTSTGETLHVRMRWHVRIRYQPSRDVEQRDQTSTRESVPSLWPRYENHLSSFTVIIQIWQSWPRVYWDDWDEYTWTRADADQSTRHRPDAESTVPRRVCYHTPWDTLCTHRCTHHLIDSHPRHSIQ